MRRGVGRTIVAAFLLVVAALGASQPVKAVTITYNLVEQAFVSQQTGLITGTLTGTITTDGSLGVGLSPSIITGWIFLLNDGADPTTNLITGNSFVTFNFSDLFVRYIGWFEFQFLSITSTRHPTEPAVYVVI